MQPTSKLIVLCLLVFTLILSACQPKAPEPAAAISAGAPGKPAVPPAAAATAAPNDVTGPGGGSVVTVSGGVVLLTPGAPLPTPDLSDLITEMHAFIAADLESDPIEVETAAFAPPDEPVDVSSIELPEGISLYPGAADFQTAPEGESMQYVVFYTADDPSSVLETYAQQADLANYSNISLDLPNARGEYDGSWMKGGLILSITAYPGDRTKVMIAWMKM
jgi:hypothetical protein